MPADTARTLALYRVTATAWGGTPLFVLAESATEAEEVTRAPAPSYTRLAELPGDAEEIGAALEEARALCADVADLCAEVDRLPTGGAS